MSDSERGAFEMKLQVKVSLAIAAVFVAVLATLLFVSSRGGDGPPADPKAIADSQLIREDSRVLNEETAAKAALVEFLDFECEACRAAYPMVEDLRKKYGDRVRFVVRYFPMPGHFNSERAARAVESAARQGKLEEMYHRMYETQETWGEKRVPRDDLFRQFAVDLGLDMDQYDADYVSDEVAARVQRDLEDGLALGVQGTPTFFLNGERLEPATIEEFERAVSDAADQ